MTQRSALMARRPLAAALFVALIAPGMAFAQTAKEKALEARVAELERQVQLLLSSQQQQQTQIATTQEQVTQVQAALTERLGAETCQWVFTRARLLSHLAEPPTQMVPEEDVMRLHAELHRALPTAQWIG